MLTDPPILEQMQLPFQSNFVQNPEHQQQQQQQQQYELNGTGVDEVLQSYEMDLDALFSHNVGQESSLDGHSMDSGYFSIGSSGSDSVHSPPLLSGADHSPIDILSADCSPVLDVASVVDNSSGICIPQTGEEWTIQPPSLHSQQHPTQDDMMATLWKVYEGLMTPAAGDEQPTTESELPTDGAEGTQQQHDQNQQVGEEEVTRRAKRRRRPASVSGSSDDCDTDDTHSQVSTCSSGEGGNYSSSSSSSAGSDKSATGSRKRKRKGRSEEERMRTMAERQRELDALVALRATRKLTAKEQARLRAIRNQITAQESRDRKSGAIERLTRENEELKRENAGLKRRVQELETELAEYRSAKTSSGRSTLAVFMVLLCVGILCFQFKTMENAGDLFLGKWQPEQQTQQQSPVTIMPQRATHQRNIKALPSPGLAGLVQPPSPVFEQHVTIVNQVPQTPTHHNEAGMDSARLFDQAYAQEGNPLGQTAVLDSPHEVGSECEEVYLEDMDRAEVLVPSLLKRHLLPQSAAKNSRQVSAVVSSTAHRTSSVKEGEGDSQSSMEYGSLYHYADHGCSSSSSSDTGSGRPVLHFFCPYAYSVLPSSENSADCSAGGVRDVDTKEGRTFDIKLYIPDHRLSASSASSGEKVFRVAELTARDVEMGEAFFAFDHHRHHTQQQQGQHNRAH